MPAPRRPCKVHPYSLLFARKGLARTRQLARRTRPRQPMFPLWTARCAARRGATRRARVAVGHARPVPNRDVSARAGGLSAKLSGVHMPGKDSWRNRQRDYESFTDSWLAADMT